MIACHLILYIFHLHVIGPILRRSAFGKDSPTKSNIPQNIRPFQSEDVDEEQQGLSNVLYKHILVVSFQIMN